MQPPSLPLVLYHEVGSAHWKASIGSLSMLCILVGLAFLYTGFKLSGWYFAASALAFVTAAAIPVLFTEPTLHINSYGLQFHRDAMICWDDIESIDFDKGTEILRYNLLATVGMIVLKFLLAAKFPLMLGKHEHFTITLDQPDDFLRRSAETRLGLNLERFLRDRFVKSGKLKARLHYHWRFPETGEHIPKETMLAWLQHWHREFKSVKPA